MVVSPCRPLSLRSPGLHWALGTGPIVPTWSLPPFTPPASAQTLEVQGSALAKARAEIAIPRISWLFIVPPHVARCTGYVDSMRAWRRSGGGPGGKDYAPG